MQTKYEMLGTKQWRSRGTRAFTYTSLPAIFFFSLFFEQYLPTAKRGRRKLLVLLKCMAVIFSESVIVIMEIRLEKNEIEQEERLMSQKVC